MLRNVGLNGLKREKVDVRVLEDWEQEVILFIKNRKHVKVLRKYKGFP